MKNLDWTKINDDRTFQLLVNDLFALEINNPAFLSSNPDIGPDGGWDARYVGTYMDYTGVWCFQSKWTKHNLNKAYKQLYVELKKELVKAKNNKVQYLLFATNADLKVGVNDHIGNLEKLNEGQKFVDHLFVWPRANIESKIKQYPILKYDYFGDTQEPMFVPVYVFAKSESSLQNIFLGREQSLNKLNEILSNNKNNIIVVHAGGGFGKTHFIVEAGKKYSALQTNVQTWFCRPGIRDVHDAINELDHKKNYLIFLDDAERYLEDTKKIIAHTKTFSPGKLKVVLSCRSSGKEILKNLLWSQKIDNYSLFELPLICEKQLVKILTLTAEPKKINYPERIIKELNSNLFLIIVTGQRIRGGINPQQIKKQIKNNLDSETINALDGFLDARNAKKLVKELSIIVPLSKNRPDSIIEKMSVILGIDKNLINDSIDQLIEAKILRIVGTFIRFNPDMKGDVYLSVEIDKKNGKDLVNQIFENWLSLSPEQLTVNLGAALRHKETNSANEAVRELIKKWISEAFETSNFQKSEKLSFITPLAFLAPEEVINLIYAYINSSTSTTKDILSPNRDTYGPIIYQILHLLGFENSILNLILYIARKNIKGTYDNYTPINFIKQVTSPIEVKITSAIKSLSILLNWIEKKSCSELEANLVGAGVREVLSGSHEYQERYDAQITIGRKSLVYTEPFRENVDKIRNIGMAILEKLIFHQNDQIKNIGIAIVEDIGYMSDPANNELKERILTDKKQAMDWLEYLVKKNTSFEILSSIEDILIKYWADNSIGDLSDKVADILRNYPRSLEYTIFQFFVAKDIIVTNFSEIEKDAPQKNRWSWLVQNYFRLRNFKQEELNGAVKQLSEKYKRKDDIITYLNKLSENIQGISQWQYIPLIETWARLNKQVFIEIVRSKLFFSNIPERFHLGIYRVASDVDRKYITEYAEKILAELGNLQHQSVDNLLDLISRNNVPVEKFMPWLSQIINKADSYIKKLILHRAYFIFKDRSQIEKKRVIDIINLSLNEKVDNHVLDMFDFLLNNVILWNLPINELDKIRNKLLEIIKNIVSIEYHTDELIKFAINGDLNKFLNLVECRLKKNRDSFDQQEVVKRFTPIPYEGFRSAEGLIKNYNDFSVLMDKINFWRSEGLLDIFNLNSFLKAFDGPDKKSKNYLYQYINEKIEQGGENNLQIVCNILPGVSFKEDTANLFLDFLLLVEKTKFFQKAKDVFNCQVLSGSYSSAIGEPPIFLVKRKEILKKIYDSCPPGSIKNYIDDLIQSIAKDIQRHLDDGVNFKY